MEPIESFNYKTRSIAFQDGQVAADVDKVIYCTGYNYSHPFLRNGIRSGLVNGEGFQIHGLWEHMFWIQQPTLIFIGIPKDGPTFLISQAQAAYAARYLAGRSGVPPRTVMRKDFEEDLSARMDARLLLEDDTKRKIDILDKKPHQLQNENSKGYIETLRVWCEDDAAAMGRSVTRGNVPPRWTDRIDWVMMNREELRRAYKKRGCLRQKYPTPESLGFKQCPPKK